MFNSPYVTIGIVFSAGAILFGIGSWIVTRLRERDSYDARPAQADSPPPASEPVAMQWTQSLGASSDAPLALDERLDLVERLALLGEPWCVDVLRDAAREESDPKISEAIASALRAAP